MKTTDTIGEFSQVTGFEDSASRARKKIEHPPSDPRGVRQRAGDDFQRQPEELSDGDPNSDRRLKTPFFCSLSAKFSPASDGRVCR